MGHKKTNSNKIQLRFRDIVGTETLVTFWENGMVTVNTKGTVTKYSKDSPIAAVYQNMLANQSTRVDVNAYRVTGAW